MVLELMLVMEARVSWPSVDPCECMRHLEEVPGFRQNRARIWTPQREEMCFSSSLTKCLWDKVHSDKLLSCELAMNYIMGN